jgi:hypothetical protein
MKVAKLPDTGCIRWSTPFYRIFVRYTGLLATLGTKISFSLITYRPREAGRLEYCIGSLNTRFHMDGNTGHQPTIQLKIYIYINQPQHIRYHQASGYHGDTAWAFCCYQLSTRSTCSICFLVMRSNWSLTSMFVCAILRSVTTAIFEVANIWTVFLLK